MPHPNPHHQASYKLCEMHVWAAKGSQLHLSPENCLDWREPPCPEKPEGLRAVADTGIQRLGHLVSRLHDSVGYSCSKAFRGIGLRLDVSWNHIFASSPALSCPLHSIAVSSGHIPSIDHLHNIPIPGSHLGETDTFAHQTRSFQQREG